jgi:hypothetical protein
MAKQSVTRQTDGTRPTILDWLRRRFTDRRTAVSQLASVGVHLLLVVIIALVWLSRTTQRPAVNSPDIEVVEYEPDVAAGPDKDYARVPELKAGERRPAKPRTPDAPPLPDAPETKVEPAKVQPEDLRLTETIDPAERAKQLADLEAVLKQLRENIDQSDSGGGGEGGNDTESHGGGGRDPYSRKECARRWKILYSDLGCDAYGHMLRDIDIDEIGATEGSHLLLFDPVSGAKRNIAVSNENRIFWLCEPDSPDRCGTKIISERAGFIPIQVIWFMSKKCEDRLKALEAAYVQEHKISITNVKQTIFVPVNSGSKWELVVSEMHQ